MKLFLSLGWFGAAIAITMLDVPVRHPEFGIAGCLFGLVYLLNTKQDRKD